MLLPGLGQIVNGQYLVGGGLVLASIVGVYMMCTGVDVHGVESALHQDMAAMADSTREIPPAPQVGFGFWVGALLITLAWLYSLCDSIFSKRKNAPGR